MLLVALTRKPRCRQSLETLTEMSVVTLLCKPRRRHPVSHRDIVPSVNIARQQACQLGKTETSVSYSRCLASVNDSMKLVRFCAGHRVRL